MAFSEVDVARTAITGVTLRLQAPKSEDLVHGMLCRAHRHASDKQTCAGVVIFLPLPHDCDLRRTHPNRALVIACHEIIPNVRRTWSYEPSLLGFDDHVEKNQ